MKKLMVSTIILLPLLILAIMLVSGAIMSMIVHIYVEKVEFVKSETLVLVMKDESTPPEELLQVNVFPLEADNQDLVFSIEDTGVATVDENGKITANYYGETFVTVTSAENKAASAKRKVLVTDNTVHAINIKEFENDMYRGDAPQRLLAEVIPFEANNKSLIWVSSNPSVLSVTGSGDITCRGAGTATITATSADNPEVKASVEIRCHEPLRSLSAETSSVVTALTEAEFPKLSSTPENATYTVVYSSSDENIARVDENGNIKFRKAGAVTVTATAEDGRGHVDTVSVKYHCTNGYYMGGLFEKTTYSFDYDVYAGKKLEEIELLRNPEGSYRQIVEVTYDKPGVLSFDKYSETFTLNDVEDETELGLVTVTIKANKYDYDSAQIKEFITDVCQVNVTRRTKNISFDLQGNRISRTNISARSINLTEVKSGSAESGIGVIADPANHTDRISYSVTGAAHMKNSVLVFDKVGTAVVTAQAEGKEGISATAQLSVSYAEPRDSDKKITVNDDIEEQFVTLTLHENGAKETGVLEVAVPEGTRAVYTSDSPVIKVEKDNRLVPQKGGFATITVTFEPISSSSLTAGSSCKVKVYVDEEVLPDDILFSVDDGFSTSRESLQYTVSLDVPWDAMEGKTLFVGGEEQKLVQINGKLQATMIKNFAPGEVNATLSASVRYDSEAERFAGKHGEICSSDCRIYTTHGKLEMPPKVYLGTTELSETERNSLNFPDINEQITLKVDASSAVPQDFELSQGAITFSSHNIFDYRIDVVGNLATLTLTAKEGGTEKTTLQIAGQTYTFDVSVAVLAHTAKVQYEDTELSTDVKYTTLLPSLELSIYLFREDDQAITEREVSYSFGDGEWTTAQSDGKICTITLSFDGRVGSDLHIKCGKAVCDIQLEKLELENLDLVYHIEYSDNGNVIEFEPFSVDGGLREYCFPKAIQGSFDICIEKPELENNLGGYDLGELQKFFSLTYPEGWDHEVSEEKITVKLPAGDQYFLNQELTLHCGEEKEFTLVFNCSDMVLVELPGFDYKKSDDVYLGYQQVRVFAKQSDYGNGTTVDFYRIPIKAVKDSTNNTPAAPDSILWTLSRVKEDGKQEVITTQRGDKVIYNGETYTIEKGTNNGSSKLTQEGGNVIAEDGKYQTGATKVTFVDVYASEGYADIYFGNFGGLSESDVQNDYFGNFGEEENWKKTPTAKDDQSGRTFNPSTNAYSFLRVEASDGAKDSKVNTHYNFNVLEDSDVYNVFNANGYFAHNKLVLHNNLYAEGELKEGDEITETAKKNGQIFEKTVTWSEGVTKYAKQLIYGNGYQVNLNALNDSITESMLNNKVENTSNSTKFDTLYNVTLKGANPTEELIPKNIKMYFILGGAYYSDLQYYSKLGPKSQGEYELVCFKNCTLRYVANAAIQLWVAANNQSHVQKIYFEDTVISECMRAVSLENGTAYEIYIKGVLDILNYYNMSGAQSAFGAINGGGTYKNYFADGWLNESGAIDYVEWFGGDSSKVTSNHGLFVNLGITFDPYAQAKIQYWDEGASSYSETLSEGSKSKELTGVFIGMDLFGFKLGLTSYTYAAKSSVDGGSSDHKSREMDKLFTEERYLRLLCEYKTSDTSGKLEKNTDHILWHMQQVYRDVSKIKDREQDHLTHLKDSLKGVNWPDGSGVDDEGNPHDASGAAELTAMISETVLPSKRESV